MYYNLRGLFLFRCLKKALADYFRLYFTTTRTYGPNTTCRTQPADWLSRMTGSVVEWSADLIVANCARPAQVWGYVRSTEAPVVDNLISRLRLVRRTIRLVTCKQTARPVGSSRYISSTHFKTRAWNTCTPNGKLLKTNNTFICEPRMIIHSGLVTICS